MVEKAFSAPHFLSFFVFESVFKFLNHEKENLDE